VVKKKRKYVQLLNAMKLQLKFELSDTIVKRDNTRTIPSKFGSAVSEEKI
jgi:hypothetical protein